jgi:acetyltransferase
MEKKLDGFFNARSVVIFGLSPNPGNLGRNIVANSRRWKYSGNIYGISPTPGENDGVKIYKSLDELPEKPELALIFTKAALVPDIVLDCARQGLKTIAVSSAGFEETGRPEGIELAKKLKDICREKKVLLVGPNGIATANTQNGLCLSFMPLDFPPAGKIAFITQSGGVGTSMCEKMATEAFPLGKFVSLGNKTVLDEVDFLEYFAQDPETEVICIYLEDMRRGREFCEVARRTRKPLIVYKANITPYGQAAASSHTAALKNDEAVMDGAFRQAGIIRARSLAELMTLARAFLMPALKGNRLLVISPSGGLSVILADLAYKHGFQLPPIPRELIEKYSAQRRAGVIDFKNPLDFGDIYSAEIQKNFLRDLLRREEFDGLATAYLYRDPEVLKKYYHTLGQLQRDLVAEFCETIEITGKPVGFVLIVPFRVKEQIMARTKYPIYDMPEDAVNALARMRDYYQALPKKETGSRRQGGLK